MPGSRVVSVLCLLLALSVLGTPPAEAATISFSGQTWNVQSGTTAPGPNHFAASNAFVDPSGALHLRISRVHGQWLAGEVVTTTPHGFGHYSFDVEGPLGGLDPNVIASFFGYLGPDGQNEIDVEAARYGVASAPRGHFTVYPAVAGPAPVDSPFQIPAGVTRARFDVDWSSTSVTFHATDTTNGGSMPLASWTYAPANPTANIPQQPMPIYLNLWLWHGAPPTNGRRVEIIVHSVTMPA